MRWCRRRINGLPFLKRAVLRRQRIARGLSALADRRVHPGGGLDGAGGDGAAGRRVGGILLGRRVRRTVTVAGSRSKRLRERRQGLMGHHARRFAASVILGDGQSGAETCRKRARETRIMAY